MNSKSNRTLQMIAFVLIALLLIGFVLWKSGKVTPHKGNTDGGGSTSQSSTTVSKDLNKTIKVVHTDAVVVDDEHWQPNSCKVQVSDEKGKLYEVTASNKNQSPVKDLIAKGYYVPDANCNPGGVDPAVTQANIDKTICTSGYTTPIRPPASATNKLKALSYDAYGLKADKTTEFDHIISLQLGGASSASNLFVQPNKTGATGTTNPKDPVETTLKKAVCDKKITLVEAQNAISTNWVTALHVLKLDNSSANSDGKDDDDSSNG